MPHRSHLKQQNKRFKKVKRTKNKVRNRKIEKGGKKKEVNKLKDILNNRFQSYKDKIKGLKFERKEKGKYIPFYETLNICILSFHESVDVLSFKKDFIEYLYLENEDSIEIDTIQLYDIYTVHFSEKKKNRCLTIYDIPRTVYGIIDGTKCADIVLCLFKDASLENSCFDEIGYELSSVLKSQGIPSIIGVSYKNEIKNRKLSQSFVLRYFNSEFTEKDKLIFINEKKDFYKLYHEIWNTKIKRLSFREGRGYMLVDSCAHNSEQNIIYLKGFVKGVGFNTLNPIHITNIGDYFIEDIFALDIQVNQIGASASKKKKKEYHAFNVEETVKECTDGNNNEFVNKSNTVYPYNNALLDFLNNHKSNSSNFEISYVPVHIQDRKQAEIFDEDDDFSCIRPLDIINLNEQNNVTRLMTLKNKDEREGWNILKKRNSDISQDSSLGNYTDDETESGTNSGRESASNSYEQNVNDKVSEDQNRVTYKFNFNLKNFEKEKNFENETNFTNKSQMEKTNNALNSTRPREKSKWTFISEEKHEYNEDVICSFGKKDESLNDNRVEDISDKNYQMNTFETLTYEDTGIKHNSVYPNGIYNNRDGHDNDDSDEMKKDPQFQISNREDTENDERSNNGSESDTENELNSGKTLTKLTDSAGDECFELNSVRSDQLYLHPNVNAKERFKKYRSLASFLSTRIDVYEELPLEYSRIYDYESYHNLTKYSQKKYLNDCNFINNKFSLTDTYCVIVIANDTDNTLLNMIRKKPKNIPLIISSLLPYERKVTVLNMKVKKNSYYEEKIYSKEKVEIVCGFRHFLSRPIYSEQYLKAVQSRALYERHLKPGENKVASIYGFTTTTRSSVCLLKETDTTAIADDMRCDSHSYKNLKNNINISNEKSMLPFKNDYNELAEPNNFAGNDFAGNNLTRQSDSSSSVLPPFHRLVNPVVVAVGSVMNCDCRRLIMKRISITGRPYKIHKKKVVVRGMFYNPKDINYFKPVELQTKLGLSGKILESLGTHGKMKCVFNNSLKAHDVIFMNLYKRVYPKWFPLSWNDPRNYGPDENISENEEEANVF